MNKLAVNFTALILIISLGLNGPVGLVLAQEATPSAESSTTENSTTGANSTNTATATVDQTSTTTNTNDAIAVNTTDALSASGDNAALDNTGDASITTNTAATSATTSTETNQTIWEPMPWTTWTGEGDWQTRAENSTTGADSTNTATTSVSQTDTLTNTNTADVTNSATTTSLTGANVASDNTGSATISTGNASTTTATQTTANTNIVSWTGEGDWSNLWNGEAVNFLTGANSTNTSSVDFTKVLDVLNENGVNVDNLIASFATSGDNIASDNTGNATITTGSALVLSTLFNLVNTNIFGTDIMEILYQDIFGTFSGNIDLSFGNLFSLPNLISQPLTLNSSNDTTGFNSDNTATTVGSFTVDITNDNSGVLNNALDLFAITGSNTASDNTGNVLVETGNAEVMVNLVNFLNTNISTNELYLGVINVFGDWTGNLILPEYNGVTSSSPLPLLSSTKNIQTGATSDNTATMTTDNILTVDNTNNATVDNVFNLFAETGGNSASDNTLSASVTTGLSQVEANQATFANTNVVSNAPWWLVIINNLGTWVPVLLPPLNIGTQLVLDLDDLGMNIPSSSETLDLTAANNLTGSLSSNEASVTLNSETNITNTNVGTIINDVSALASTGGNEASRNTGSATIASGNASILVNTLNFLNTNVIAPSILISIVNVFGSWMGDVLSFGTQAPLPAVSAPDQPIAQAENSGNITNAPASPSNPTTSSETNSSQSSPSVNFSSAAPLSSVSNNQSTTPPNFNTQSNIQNQEGEVLAFYEEKGGGDGGFPSQVNEETPDTKGTLILMLIALTAVLFILTRVSRIISRK
ncbi:MAG: hypothetical protein HYW45_03920 [Candidatus Daviesbacteria bacterium]|nr:MAG: hypothetical protein HYW45_03920 [Candidatus Daviesbacteria bacterium]